MEYFILTDSASQPEDTVAITDWWWWVVIGQQRLVKHGTFRSYIWPFVFVFWIPIIHSDGRYRLLAPLARLQVLETLQIGASSRPQSRNSAFLYIHHAKCIAYKSLGCVWL